MYVFRHSPHVEKTARTPLTLRWQKVSAIQQLPTSWEVIFLTESTCNMFSRTPRPTLFALLWNIFFITSLYETLFEGSKRRTVLCKHWRTRIPREKWLRNLFLNGGKTSFHVLPHFQLSMPVEIACPRFKSSPISDFCHAPPPASMLQEPLLWLWLLASSCTLSLLSTTYYYLPTYYLPTYCTPTT